MKEWLVAHRGAQKDAKENTIKAFKDAVGYPIAGIELDIHATIDGVVICHHDFFIKETNIAEKSYKELKELDPSLATFDQAITTIAGKVPIFVEIKPTGVTKHIVEILNNHKNWPVLSFKIEVIEELINSGIDKKRLFLNQHPHSFGQLKRAKKLGIAGIGVNQRWMTPRMYRRAIYKDMQIFTYVVNSKWQAKLFRLLYPKLIILTDRPDFLQSLN